MGKIKRMFIPKLPEDIGDIHIEWDFPEFVQEVRSRAWYIGFTLVLAALLIYAIITANYLFAIILVLSVFIIVYQFFQKPRLIPVVIGEDGIILDKKFYPYKILRSFAIIYEPPLTKFLYIDFKADFKKSMPIPLEDINPIKVREYLLNYIEEDIEREEEDIDENLAHIMKIR